LKIIAKSLDTSDPSRVFLDGSIRRAVRLRTAAIGLGTYQPGWRWSIHAGPQTGKPSEKHVGYIVSGHMAIKDSDGGEIRVGPGDGFEVMPGHDAWVLGDEPCIAIDFAEISEKEEIENRPKASD
jgi:hypothetical protein